MIFTPMPLAPPFTRENAGDNARKATIAREANRLNKLMASLPERATGRAIVQVNNVLTWMEKEKDKAEYAKLAAILDRLWDMAYPKQAPLKSRLSQRKAAPSASPTPQEPGPDHTRENAANQTISPESDNSGGQI